MDLVVPRDLHGFKRANPTPFSLATNNNAFNSLRHARGLVGLPVLILALCVLNNVWRDVREIIFN